jgi:periplasmic protein TonB
MFERTVTASWDERSRFGLTTLTSFAVQAFALAVLLIVPLLRPTGIPLLRQLATPISLNQFTEEPRPIGSHIAPNSPLHASPAEIFLRQPAQIPSHIPTDSDAAAPVVGSGPYIPGVGDTVGSHGVFGSIGMGSAPVIPAAPVAVEHTVRLSHMSEGDLVRKVLPTYPPLARSARIQGTVVLVAMISKQGTIENLRLLSGHPILAPAAIEAVRQWRYRPYILNSEPVEVETQITVNFSLAGN